MAKPKSKTSFQTLQKEWYLKLAASGFKDIEESPHYLKEWDSHYFQSNYDPLSFHNKAEYYRMAQSFLLSHPFVSYLEMKVWELHTEGISVRDIASTLKEQHSPHCNPNHCDLFCSFSQSMLYATRLNKDKVSFIIRRLSDIMLSPLKKGHKLGDEFGG